MDVLFLSLAFTTAGISIAMGSLSLAVGLKTNRNYSYLFFGTMCWTMVGFIALPPMGFIVRDPDSYSGLLLFKRAFIFLYYAILPWFIYHYTGRPGRAMPWFISSFSVLCYLVMAIDPFTMSPPLWTYGAQVIFATNLAYGIACTWSMSRSEKKAEARWLGIAIVIFGVLFLSNISDQTYFVFTNDFLYGMQVYFPMHLHSLALLFIMGLRLQKDAIHKLILEKVVEAQRLRWKAFLENSPLLIIECDRSGNIVTANELAATKLGLSSSQALLGVNFFDLFSSNEERLKVKEVWKLQLHPATMAPIKDYFRLDRRPPVLVNWLSFAGTSEPGGGSNLVLVGQDLTSQESALTEISKLRQEIEKESLTIFYSPATNSTGDIIGTSRALGYTMQKAMQVASTNAPVLLEGETGVGKELFADFIQSNSLRKNKPFIKVNCSAMPSDLIEDELFGHEKGAFTSAATARTGRFELADGGTILLDEIGELPLAVQPKLLRVLQQGEFERVGGQKTIRVDVRVIAATNRDLNTEVAEGRFRGDLLYRLNLFPISIPPLRNRKEDIDLLASHFIQSKSLQYNKVFAEISKADLNRLREYPWPGNIRELRNLIERSIIQSDSSVLRLQWLDHGLETDTQTDSSLEQIERDHILKILYECSWKINGANGAAERLDMNPNTLRSKMKKLNIVREQHV
jgi:formate hydrogenlyase transcriptional activator